MKIICYEKERKIWKVLYQFVLIAAWHVLVPLLFWAGMTIFRSARAERWYGFILLFSSFVLAFAVDPRIFLRERKPLGLAHFIVALIVAAFPIGLLFFFDGSTRF